MPGATVVSFRLFQCMYQRTSRITPQMSSSAEVVSSTRSETRRFLPRFPGVGTSAGGGVSSACVGGGAGTDVCADWSGPVGGVGCWGGETAEGGCRG